MNTISIKKQRFYFALAIYVVLLLSLPFGEGWGGVFAQQLSPRYILTKSMIKYPGDSTRTFGPATPTGINGEMVGVANTTVPDPQWFYRGYPHLYRLDSTGKYIGLTDFKISTPYDWSVFEKVIPFKDSLYIIGHYRDNGSFSSAKDNQFILKTDKTGNVHWKKKWGDDGVLEIIADETICSDGGIAFVGERIGLRLPDMNGSPFPQYESYKASIVKLNADGTVKFNKSYQIPDSLNIAGGYILNTIITETPDKGCIMAANATWGLDGKNRGLFLLKVDANGNKLWDKGIEGLATSLDIMADMIPHPAGGYLLIGLHNNKSYMVKINESGNVDWIKSLYFPTTWRSAQIGHIILTTSTVSAPGFIVSGGIIWGESNILSQKIIVKVDLSGNVLWSREYGAEYDPTEIYPSNSGVYEEPGGSLVTNYLASPFDANLPPVLNPLCPTCGYVDNPLNDKGILRLNDQGYLGDPVCSLSPKILVSEEDTTSVYSSNIIFETTPTPINTLGAVTLSPLTTPTVTYGVCGNPLLADFQYQIICPDIGTGATVKFTNSSRAGSWFQYNFGDPASGAKNVSDSINPQHTYSSYGTYTVSLTAWDGDSSKTHTISKAIEISLPRYITISPSDTSICEGAVINLNATISSGSFPFPSILNESFFSLKDNFAPFYAAAFTDTTYNSRPLSTTIYGADPLNRIFTFYISSTSDKCVFGDTVKVTVLPTVNISITGASPICVGDSSLLIASGSTGYLWNPGGSTNDSLWVSPAGTATYTVSSGQTKVCGTNTAQLTITVYALPTIDAGKNQTIEPGIEVQLAASGGISYVWFPAENLSSTTVVNPTTSPTQTTTYTVTGIDANGCVGSDTVTIVVNPPCSGTVFVPTAFSPNSDGINELECVLGSSCIQTFSFAIYDRWGNQVFKTDDPKICWDGKYNGKVMNAAVFVYSLQGTLKGGGTINQKGNISLVR